MKDAVLSEVLAWDEPTCTQYFYWLWLNAAQCISRSSWKS